MNSFLKQSTGAQTRTIGPFIDDTDFKTAATPTLANTDIKLMKNGATAVNKNSGGGTALTNGMQAITFDATDTGTVGELMVSVKVAGSLNVFHTFVVLEEAVHDMLFGSGAVGYVANAPMNAAQVGGQSASAAGAVTFPGTIASTTNITAGTMTTVGAVTGLTASDVAAIKAKTDSLTYTVANVLDANIQRINDVVITGNGGTGTEFGV